VSGSIWDRLGIERTRETRVVRRAYAARLKTTNPEDDAAGFQALREAYEAALRYCETGFDMSGVRFYYDAPEDDDDDSDEEVEAGHGPGEASSRSADSVVPGPGPMGIEQPSPDAAPEGQGGMAALGEQAALAASRERLLALLRSDPPASESAIAMALDDMMTQPALQGLDARSDWEFWLARTIRQESPRSDPLITLAVNRLKWRRHGDGALGRAVDAAFDRRDALDYLKELRMKRHPDHAAFKALSAPPPRSVLSYLLRPSPLARLPGLITRLEDEFPSLEETFPHLQAWRQWLEVPRLSPVVLWIVIILAPVGALSSVMLGQQGSFLVDFVLWLFVSLSPMAALSGVVLDQKGSLFADLVLALGGVLLVTGLAFGWLYGILIPRRRWHTQWRWRAPAWVEHGWAPAAGALILLSTGLSGLSWTAIPTGLLGIAIVIWAAITGDMDRREGETAWWVRMLRANAYYLIWIALLAWRGPPAAQVMTPALLAAGAASALGSQSLLDFWCSRLAPSARRTGVQALLAVVGLAIALLFLARSEPIGQGMMVALCAIALLAARPLAETVDGTPLVARHWIGWISLIVLFNLLSAGTPFDLQLICTWILIGPLIVGAAALKDAIRDVRRT